MQSPSFLGHLLGLFVVAANLLAAALWLLVTKRVAGPATPAAVLQRSAAIVYATASVLVFVVALLLFLILEVSGGARAQWLTSARWRDVQPGMTATKVRALLGRCTRRPPPLSSPSCMRSPPPQDGASISFLVIPLYIGIALGWLVRCLSLARGTPRLAS